MPPSDPLSASFSGKPAPDEGGEATQVLVRRAQKRDPEALNELMLRYAPRLRRIVSIRMGAMLRARTESVDLLQSALRIACENIERFEYRGKGSLLNWLARIAENRILDKRQYFRADRRALEREIPREALGRALDESGLGFDPQAAAPGPADEAARGELAEIIDDCLMELKDEYREAILLRDYCGASYELLAERLGKESQRAAEGVYYRARIKLFQLARPRLKNLL